MPAYVPLPVASGREGRPAHPAHIGLLARVRSHVQFEVLGAFARPAARGAHKLTVGVGPGVYPAAAGQQGRQSPRGELAAGGEPLRGPTPLVLRHLKQGGKAQSWVLWAKQCFLFVLF